MDLSASFYAPNFEKVGSILVSACAFVRPFVLPSLQNRIQARVLKFHIWIPHQKLAYPYFFYAPNFEKVGSILVSACAFVRPSVRPVKTEFKLGF